SATGGPGAAGVVGKGTPGTLDHVRVTVAGDGSAGFGHPPPAPVDPPPGSATHPAVSRALVGLDVTETTGFGASHSQFTGASIGVRDDGRANFDRVAVATTAANSQGIIATDSSLGLSHVTVAHESTDRSGTDTALSLNSTNIDSSATLEASALAGYTHGI